MLPDNIPGLPSDNPATDPSVVRAGVATTLFDCTTKLAAVEQSIRDSVNACLSECRGPVDVCHACIAGELSRRLDTSSTAVAKCYQKIWQRVDALLSESGGLLAMVTASLPGTVLQQQQLSAISPAAGVNPASTPSTGLVYMGCGDDCSNAWCATHAANNGMQMVPIGTVLPADTNPGFLNSCLYWNGPGTQIGVTPCFCDDTGGGDGGPTPITPLPATYDCVDGKCVVRIDGNGQYQTLVDCIAACSTPPTLVCPPQPPPPPPPPPPAPQCCPPPEDLCPCDETPSGSDTSTVTTSPGAVDSTVGGPSPWNEWTKLFGTDTVSLSATVPDNVGGNRAGGTCTPQKQPKPFCPAIPSVPGAIGGTYDSQTISWCDPEACANAATFHSVTFNEGEWLLKLIGSWWQDSQPVLKGVNDGASGQSVIGKTIASVIVALLAGACRFANWLGGAVVASNPTLPGGTMIAALGTALPNWAGRIMGIETGPLTRPFTMLMNYTYPNVLPSPPEADELFNAGMIDEKLWNCYQLVAGHCPDHFSPLRDIKRTRPDPLQTTVLLNREVIVDTQWDLLLKNMGVINQGERSWYKELLHWIPGPSDLVRFMVRDSFDEQVAADYQYDKDFTLKFTEPLQKLAKAQGMDNDTFLKYWRSHWQLPSTGQFFQMLHRLRPEIYGQVQPQGISVDPAFIQRAIEINDMSPVFVQRLMEISYLPLTRIDASRAYDIGIIDDDGVVAAYQDVGYKLENAKTLQKFRARQRDLMQLRSADPLGARAVVKAFMAGVLDENDARAYLGNWYLSEANINRVIIDAREANNQRRSDEVVRAVKSKFLKGGLDPDEAYGYLINAGMADDYITAEVQHWQDLLELRSKEITAAKLCGLASDGLIGSDEYVERLRRLGYSEVDAGLLAGDCRLKMLEKLQKQLDAQQKKLETAIEAEARRQLAEMWKQYRASVADAKWAQGRIDTWAREKARLMVTEWRELCRENPKTCPPPPIGALSPLPGE